MLFHKVAINPDDFVDSEILDALKYNFGWHKNRLVVDLPKNWNNSVLQKANTLSDGYLKLKVKSLLNKIAVIDSGIGDVKTNNWNSLITQADTLSLYNALISSSDTSLSNRYDTNELERYINESEERIGSFAHKNLSPKAIVDVLDPFLRVSKRLVLVNSYQYLFDNKSRSLFEALFLRWQHYDGINFKVIRSMRTEVKFDQNKWDKEVESLGHFLKKHAYKYKFNYIAVNDDANRLHQRYLIGPACGINIDYGLEILEKPQTWEVLRESNFLTLKDKFLEKDVLDLYPEHLVYSYKT